MLANLSDELQSITLNVKGEELMNNYVDLERNTEEIALQPYQGVYLLS